MPVTTPHPTRHTRRGPLLLAAVALSATALVPATAASAAPVELAAPVLSAPGSATVGDVITVTLTADQVTDLYAYDVELSFDPALLSPVDDSAELPDGGHSSSRFIDGTAELTHTRLGGSPGLTGEQSLLSLDFTTLAAGDATVSLTAGELVSSDLGQTGFTTELSSATTIAAAPAEGADSDASAGTGADADSDSAAAADGSSDATGTDSAAATGAADASGSDATAGSDGSAGSDDTTDTATGAPAAGSAGTPLATTGAQAGALAAAAAFAGALIALGLTLTARRKKAQL